MNYEVVIAERLGMPSHSVRAVLDLLAEGATIPFIARYRKEVTGSLDEVAILAIKMLHEKLEALDKRKAYVLKTIEAAGALTPEMEERLNSTLDADEVEDIFAPYKPRRQTRATAARERGLEPLARILASRRDSRAPEAIAAKYVTDDVPDTLAALRGASDIIAEWTADDERWRGRVRQAMVTRASLSAQIVKGKEEEAAKYRSYDRFKRPLRSIPSHNFLAIKRAEREGLMRVSLVLEGADPEQWLTKDLGETPVDTFLKQARIDGYRRLLRPAMETEATARTKEAADRHAIDLFADNLRQLLLAPPLGHKRVMAIDPGFRTGCKVVCLDQQGNLIDHDVIYPHPPKADPEAAAMTVKMFVTMYKVQAVAVGNGTAGRETDRWLRSIGLPKEIKIYSVDESGASIYSASALAREEMPDEDITVRGAVSIGRRLIDPLAELIKIDPQSIGVGQYQHDVDQKALREALDFVVTQCVNLVGVNLNTASPRLLSYVSGLGPATAKAITVYRAEHGDFDARSELLSVPRLGPKAYEQCAGFLRIPGASNPLDNTAVHPENYDVVARMASNLGVDVERLAGDAALVDRLDLNAFVTAAVGLPTLTDIADQLRRPGRDPREEVDEFAFAPDIHEIEDVRPGMELPGRVTNVTDFGAFVNVGVHQDGLIHRSQMAGKRLRIGQAVKARVLDVDLQRRRISLTLKSL